ncbi:MAG TPA: TPM domain-containing protein, partial [Thermomicrobiaceae bacterium]|nr:TPM domain-containing protein [Thermomicrobiaceae bacterium]
MTSLAAALILALLAVLPAASASSFGTEIAGKAVYDSAGVLSPAQRSELETEANQLRQAGTPAIIYIRAESRSSGQTMDDAKSLMASWNVESAPGAKDGFVVFINLEPGNLKHGSATIYAGKALHERALPQSELDRIYDDQMTPLLKKADFAGAIGAALTGVQHDLAFGPPPPPPPSAFDRFSADASRGPLSPVNLIGLLLAAIGVFFGLRYRHTTARPPHEPIPTTVPPSKLAPALAGALVAGSASDDQLMRATLFDFASRGVLAVEPVSEDEVQIHLIGELEPRGEWEATLWRALKAQADEQGLIEHSQLANLQARWKPAKEELRASLVRRGLFEASVPDRRSLMYLVAGVLFVLALAALVLAGAGKQPAGVAGVVFLGAASVLILVLAARMSELSDEGANKAVPWIGFEQGLEASGREWNDPLNLDKVMPYAVAFGVAKALESRFESASDNGYQP